MHRLISENPSIWTHQVPSLPPKPSSFISSKTSSTFAPISTSSSELESISSSIKLGNRPNVPPLPKSLQSTKSQVNLQSSKTLTLPAAPPQLPPNPIRITLIQQASTKLNSTLLNLLNGKTEYATIPNISTILENQNDLVNCFDNYHRTENFIVDLNKGIDNNIPVIESKCIDARSLIDSVNKFVDEDYNIDNEELFVSTNKKSKQLSDLCFQEASYLDSLHFLELLFNTQKITFTDYVDNVRKISRERAKLLIWINKFK
ncbi:hypothetical protein C6P40_001026 [Pichia californica]|uniref:SB domain-containing protein n=1 Tax=Pichia californica TaxID=460514 RepID=A0A9P6WJM1_9ASCO|nr:hypothetical protein C6P40_001026 [[Candida] californica]